MLAAAAIYAVLALVFVGQGLLPDRTLSSSDGNWTIAPWTTSKPADVRPLGANFELADAVAVFQPFFGFTRAALPDIPLWNPHLMAGRPYLANAQSAIFSPFSLPAFVLPFWKSLAVMAALKLFVGAFGMFIFARALGQRFGGALLAGVVYAFGTFFVVWLAWPLTNIFPLIPWLMLCVEMVIRRPGPLPVAGLAALVALQFFGGHPETSFHLVFAATVWFAFRVVLAWRADGRRREALVRPLIGFAGAIALGTAIAALMLGPLLELLAISGDYERRQNVPPTFASPRFLGALFLSDYWGRPTQTAIEAFVSNRGWYAGGITLMLAAAGLALRPTVTRLGVAALAVLTALFVLGQPPVADLMVLLPGFETAHNGRMVIFVLFALALLAGWGLDELSGRELPTANGQRLVLGVAAAIFSVPFAWMLVAGTIDLSQLRPAFEVAWLFADPPGGSTPVEKAVAAPIVRLSSLLQWLVLAGAGLALIALRLGVPRERWRPGAAVFVGVAVAVLAADLFRANMGFNPAIPVAHARQPTTESIRFLQARRPNRFAAVDMPATFQPLAPDLAVRYGLYDARGYDYPVERRYDRLWRATAGPGGDLIPPTTLAVPTARAMRTLSLLSVTDLLQPPGSERLRLPGLRRVYAGRDAQVYRNANALPRAFMVDSQRTVRGEDAAMGAVMDGDVDLRNVAVTESRVPGLPQAGPATDAGRSAGSARLVGYEREEVRIEATVRRPGMLVLTDVHFPGWKASVDGRSVELERVNYLLKGVPLAAGDHSVELRYEPASWRAGWIVSLLGCLILVGLTALGLRGRRRAMSR